MPRFDGEPQGQMTPLGINSHLLGQLKSSLDACAQVLTDTLTSDTGAKPQPQ
ncbi:hypothetical protein [Scytonema sp. NUACC26]|uniref:hypothetical protein n=1 Tax=Scytonema sp. NUACC26 TaxID=3140176 RepID=UPI0038B31F80